MHPLSEHLYRALDDRRAPFAVGMIGTSKGISWTGTMGRFDSVTLNDQTIFRIPSMGTGIGATAGAILADRGLLQWDTPVEDILPAFGNLKVLESFSNQKSQLRAPLTRATLRHLATHTSGLVYGLWDEQVAQYLAHEGISPVVSNPVSSLATPLAFDPGDRWQYGSGVDWLGLAIEVIDGRSIQRFCEEEIFVPLQMPDTTFAVDEQQAKRLAPVFNRSGDGGFTRPSITVDQPTLPDRYGIDHSLYSTAADYMRFLRMWLGEGQLEGIRILRAETVAHSLRNHIGELRIQPLRTVLPEASRDLIWLPCCPKTHSLGFARTERDIQGMRSAGSQFFGGLLNTHFWFDPANDVAGILMTQLQPFLDEAFMSFYEDFERSVYAQLEDLKGKRA